MTNWRKNYVSTEKFDKTISADFLYITTPQQISLTDIKRCLRESTKKSPNWLFLIVKQNLKYVNNVR